MSGRWDTYLGHDRPLPMGEQSLREYHSGDPGPDEHCDVCGRGLYDGDDTWDTWGPTVRCEDCRHER